MTAAVILCYINKIGSDHQRNCTRWYYNWFEFLAAEVTA